MALRARRTGRWTDRVEDATAWILLAAGLLVVLLGGVFGIGVHDRLADQARAEALDRTPAVATLLNAAPTIGSDSTLSTPVEAAATWRDRSGVPTREPCRRHKGWTQAVRSRSGSTGQGRRCPSRPQTVMRSRWPRSPRRSPSSREHLCWRPCGASCGVSRCPTTARHGNGNGARSPRSGAAARAAAAEVPRGHSGHHRVDLGGPMSEVRRRSRV